MSTTEFKLSLRALPIKELEAKIALYQDLKSMGTRDQVLLGCYESELERRIYNWEVTEV